MEKAFVWIHRIIIATPLILLISGVLIIGGCIISANVDVEYEFFHPESEIESIHIVKVEKGDAELDGEDLPVLTELLEIDDRGNFLLELHELECHHHFSEPLYVKYDSLAFKIQYKNGDYELISEDGQARYYASKDRYDSAHGYFSFENGEIDVLLQRFLRTTP